jgi:CubicO group peptidase (beta-lactamase class C family)
MPTRLREMIYCHGQWRSPRAAGERPREEDTMRSHAALLLGLAVLAAAAPQAAALGAPEYWPSEGWRTATPESQGLSSAELSGVFDLIAEKDIQIHSLLLVRNGWLILEAYFFPCAPDTLHDICSCTKSVSSTLVGIAMDQGRIRSVKETLPQLFPGRRFANDSPPKRRMTLENILTMTTGMDYPLLGEPRLQGLRGAPDWVQVVLDLPMTAEPGMEWGYNSGGSHLLSAIVTRSTGRTAEDFAREFLFGPIGIRDWIWPKDPQGNSRGWGDLKLKSRDMARIGYLFLKKGRWDGRQVVSRDWVEKATARQTAGGGTDGYGYQWWRQKDPARFEAVGRAGQRIVVVPGIDLIMVCTGGGFDPGEVGDRIAGALRSDRAITEDPVGFALLQQKIAAASAPPAAVPVKPLPALAAEISGREYVLEENTLGLRTVSLTFPGGDAAAVSIRLDRVQTAAVGLDGVYRITPVGSGAEQVAAEGEWMQDGAFEFAFNEFTQAQNTRVRVVFEGDALTMTLTDPNNDLDIQIRGRTGE